jgi:hypothetical protein
MRNGKVVYYVTLNGRHVEGSLETILFQLSVADRQKAPTLATCQAEAIAKASTMGPRYAAAASARLGYDVTFVGWVTLKSGATLPRFKVADEHIMDAAARGICVAQS